jgi:glycosyltransferase involved in cell wall biosynthesis
MHILMMADTPPDPNRGAAGTEVQTARALRALGHHVDTIWAGDLGRRIEHGNLHLLLELPRAYERTAVRALRARHYDVVHVNQPHGFRAARAVHRLSPGTVFIHRSHGLELNVEETLAPWRARFGEKERSRVRRMASGLLARGLARHSHAIAREADGHIVSSSIDADFLAERLRVARERIAVIPQAAPDDYTSTSPPAMTPERLGRVLHVAQFAFFKAPMITAQAIERLPMRVTWVCDRAHHASIRAMLSKNANARLDLLHWTSQDELRSIYDAHGLFLFPSFFEGFGKSFLEAMSRGLVVIASDAGAMHDIIRHGANGLLVPVGDAEALVTAALALDFERAARISTTAAETARLYSWTRVARETAAFYEALVKSRSREYSPRSSRAT